MLRVSLRAPIASLALAMTSWTMADSPLLHEQVSHGQRLNLEDNARHAQVLGALVYTDVTIEADASPLSTMLRWLEDAIGVQIVLRAEDADADRPITLQIEQQPALTTLEFMLDQCGPFDDWTWQLRRGVVEIGPKSRLAASSALELRVYPILDLLTVSPDYGPAPGLDMERALTQNQETGTTVGSIVASPKERVASKSPEETGRTLATLLTEIIEPEQWSTAGGPAQLRYHRGALIVRAPDFVHRQINGYAFAPARPRSVAPRRVEYRSGRTLIGR
ncbi:MAG: hypothetical protein HKN62_18620 [Phycisphaerales bacterium]|nr:hypothetical protein [Phycisphaerales bacterium]